MLRFLVAVALAIAVTTVNGRTHAAGDVDVEFSIQSISKPFAYAAAIMDRGLERVLRTVGLEPSGEAFNELSLETGTHRPKNPMINAGALTAHALATDRAKAQEVGCDGYLAKPVEPRRVVEEVQKHLDRQAAGG